jgi:GxxExxY protein
VIIEVKAVDRLLPIHDAQLLTYLRLTGMGIGLLLNFNSIHFRDGIRRKVLSLSPSFAVP